MFSTTFSIVEMNSSELTEIFGESVDVSTELGTRPGPVTAPGFLPDALLDLGSI
jgi:hypothetical protein